MPPERLSRRAPAEGPSADRAGNMDLYGWLIGSWDLDVTGYLPDGTTRRGRASGTSAGCSRAGPSRTCGSCRRAGRPAGDAAANVNSYGTTLRIYDPRIDAWQIQWTDPVTQTSSRWSAARRAATSCSSARAPTTT